MNVKSPIRKDYHPWSWEAENPMTRIYRFTLYPILVLVCMVGPTAVAQSPRTIPLDSATVADLNAAFDAGLLTSEQLVQMCLARIRAYDRQGPSLRAFLTINPKALDVARQLDAERRSKGRRSQLHGIPVVLKDNIDTDDMPTTAGSIALEGSIPPDDASWQNGSATRVRSS
jgi:amidase